MKFRRPHFGALLLLLTALPACAGAAGLGSISGLVVDPAGTPQMGATVLISGEALITAAPEELLTNVSGRFVSDTLRPGLYTIRVTLAGFLPAIQQHIMVTGDRTTPVSYTHLDVYKRQTEYSSRERAQTHASQALRELLKPRQPGRI